jgi:hypothetical protein
LKNNNIKFYDHAKKRELLNLVKENTFNKNFTVDELIKFCSYTPSTAPYHCNLNSIEMIWVIFKHIVSKHNFNNNSIEFENLIRNTLKSITASQYAKCIRKCVKRESLHWINDDITGNDVVTEDNYSHNFIH